MAGEFFYSYYFISIILFFYLYTLLHIHITLINVIALYYHNRVILNVVLTFFIITQLFAMDDIPFDYVRKL